MEFAVNILLTDSTYMRWVGAPNGRGVWTMSGWGCAPGERYNHFEWLKKKKDRGFKEYDYCNAVTDMDMWLIAGVVELLLAHDADGNIMEAHMSTARKDYLMHYV